MGVSLSARGLPTNFFRVLCLLFIMPLKPCDRGWKRNPDTNRCYKITSAFGKCREAIERARGEQGSYTREIQGKALNMNSNVAKLQRQLREKENLIRQRDEQLKQLTQSLFGL